MSDIRGKDPAGLPRDVRTDGQGRIHTRLYGVDRFGNPQEVRVSPEGLLLTGGRIFVTPYVPIPGIGAAVEYANEDAFGTRFQFAVPTSGIIQATLVLDDDDENISVDLLLFSSAPATGTDNDAYAPSTNDLRRLEAVLNLGVRYGVNGATIGYNPGLAVPYSAPDGVLWVQAVARGALNIAAGKTYQVALRILADE